MQGSPLSAGVVEAAAWVLTDAVGAEMPHEPYILVCPSSPIRRGCRCSCRSARAGDGDGGYVARTARSGRAREFGLLAVAGIADVQRRVKTGQRLRIDGATGVVQIVG